MMSRTTSSRRVSICRVNTSMQAILSATVIVGHWPLPFA